MNLWFRGRVFYDIVNKNAYDPLADEPIAGKLLEIGRYIGKAVDPQSGEAAH